MAEAAIVTEGLTKYYGRRRGVEDLSLEVGPGEVFGFLGPNGAGKTTTIRLLLDLLRPTRGRARVLGRDVTRAGPDLRRAIGYLPGDLRLYERLTGRQLLDHLAALRGGVDPRLREELCERLGLDPTRPVRALSQGNRQKLGIVQAFMHRPRLLILDEPTNGLDPLVRQEFYRLVREARAEGRAVFLSSHVLAEVEQVCDRVAIVRDGRLLAVEPLARLKERAPRRVRVRFRKPVPADAFAGVDGLSGVRADGPVLEATLQGPADAFVKTLARFAVQDLVVEEPALEELFLAYYAGEGGAAHGPAVGSA